jgi:hypothetical protein
MIISFLCITVEIFICLLQKLKIVRDPMFDDGPLPSLTLYWDPSIVDDEMNKSSKINNDTLEQRLSLGSIVDCVVSALFEPTKFQVRL